MYVPVGIRQEQAWYPPGCSLVVVDRGCASIQYQHVTPQTAPLLAALRLARKHMIDAIRDAHTAYPKRGNRREKRAWEILRRELPGDLVTISRPSIAKIIEAIESALVQIATERKP